MPNITAKGRELASKLNPAIGTTREIMEACSLIARHATTHHALSELLCNGGTYSTETRDVPDDVRDRRIEWAERRTDAIESRICDLVISLPNTDDGPFHARFSGDPRGVTVKLTAPDEWTHLYDCFGNEGICVPQGAR